MLFTNVFSDMIDTMFDGMLPMAAGRTAMRPQTMMQCDVREYEDRYELAIDLAGFKKEDIRAELRDGYLTVKAQRGLRENEQSEEGRMIRSERFAGTCQRSFYVGEQITEADISASFTDGVLRLGIARRQEQTALPETKAIAIQ